MEKEFPLSVRMGFLPSRGGYQLWVMKAFRWPLLGTMHNKHLTITLVKKRFDSTTMIINPQDTLKLCGVWFPLASNITCTCCERKMHNMERNWAIKVTRWPLKLRQMLCKRSRFWLSQFKEYKSWFDFQCKCKFGLNYTEIIMQTLSNKARITHKALWSRHGNKHVCKVTKVLGKRRNKW